MFRTKLVSLLAVTAMLSMSTLTVDAAGPLDAAAMKNVLRQKQQIMPKVVIPHDASLASCTAYTSQVNLVNTTFSACMNPSTPPPGSPVFNFNAMSNVQLGQFCGQQNFNQCVDKVLAQQQAYCNSKVAPLKQQAERLKATCNQAKKECTDAKAKKQQIEKQDATIDIKRKQLEQELTQVIKEQARIHGELAKINVEVQKQCGIQVIQPHLPPPVYIPFPPMPHLPPGLTHPPVLPKPPIPPGLPQPHLPPGMMQPPGGALPPLPPGLPQPPGMANPLGSPVPHLPMPPGLPHPPGLPQPPLPPGMTNPPGLPHPPMPPGLPHPPDLPKPPLPPLPPGFPKPPGF